MDLIEKARPITLPLERRTKSLVLNSRTSAEQQRDGINKKSTFKINRDSSNALNHQKKTNNYTNDHHNPQTYYDVQDNNNKNPGIKRKHVRLTKRNSRKTQGNKQKQEYQQQHLDKLSKLKSCASCVLQNNQGQTLNKLVEMSIKHHDPSLCVCAYCSCGRHLCKVHISKHYSSQKSSFYNIQYNKKKPIQDLKFQLPISFKGQKTSIDPFSTYSKEFLPKQSLKDNQFLPQHLLHVGGPFDGKTSYHSHYPQHDSQKTDIMRPLGGKVQNYPFNGNSNYQKEYTPKETKKVQQIISKGNLKLGDQWIGKSTYKEKFQTPTKSYEQKWKSNLTEFPRPKYENQYDTVYKTNYISLRNTICPAVPQLFTRTKFLSCPKNPSTLKNTKRASSSDKVTI